MSEYVDTPKPSGTNRSAAVTQCKLCEGDRFVVVRLRSAHNPKSQEFYEEVAPCPDCNPIEITHWRHDGSQFRSMDSATARRAMTQ